MVTSVAFIGNSKFLVANYYDHNSEASIRFWNTETQELIGGPHSLDSTLPVPVSTFSPDGLRVASHTGYKDSNMGREDEHGAGVEKDDSERNTRALQQDVLCVAFDSQGKRFVSGIR